LNKLWRLAGKIIKVKEGETPETRKNITGLIIPAMIGPVISGRA